MEKIYHSVGVEETEKIASEFAQTIKNEKNPFIALSGDLGVGKTAFVRGLAKVFAPGAKVKSPTYTIVNEYKNGSVPLYHFDVYRISDDDELYSVGYYDYLGKGVCVVEWAENIPFAVPENAYRIKIEREGDFSDQRKITMGKKDENIIG